MNRTEVRTVKRQLEGYLDYLDLAKQAEQEADELEKQYEAMAGIRSIAISRNDSGKNSGMKPDNTTRFLEIFDQQDELLRQAETYRAKAWRCRRFIESIQDSRKKYLRMAYLEGGKLKNISSQEGYSISSISKAVDGCLEAVPSSMARAAGVL